MVTQKSGYQHYGKDMKKKTLKTIQSIIESKFFGDLIETGLLDEADIVIMLQKQDFLKDESRIAIAEAVFKLLK